MLATAWGAAVVGVRGHLVRVEADTAAGFPRFSLLGRLPRISRTGGTSSAGRKRLGPNPSKSSANSRGCFCPSLEARLITTNRLCKVVYAGILTLWTGRWELGNGSRR